MWRERDRGKGIGGKDEWRGRLCCPAQFLASVGIYASWSMPWIASVALSLNGEPAKVNNESCWRNFCISAIGQQK